MTGYDVAKRFASSVGFLWHASNSQIYPELRKLESEGLLDTQEIPWGTKGVTKTEYSITDLGMEEIRKWQQEPMGYTPDRDPARLKAAYMEMGNPQSAEANLRDHIAHFEDQRLRAEAEINRIDSGTSPNLTRRLEKVQDSDREATIAFKRFAYEGRVDQAEAEIRWAKRGLKLLEELYGEK